MGTVSVDNLKPGMKLAEDAVAGGNTLLTSGIELNEKHIDIFKSWGLNEVEIEGASDSDFVAAEMNELDSNVVKKLNAKLKPLFSLNDMEDPFIRELYRLSVLHNATRKK